METLIEQSSSTRETGKLLKAPPGFWVFWIGPTAPRLHPDASAAYTGRDCAELDKTQCICAEITYSVELSLTLKYIPDIKERFLESETEMRWGKGNHFTLSGVPSFRLHTDVKGLVSPSFPLSRSVKEGTSGSTTRQPFVYNVTAWVCFRLVHWGVKIVRKDHSSLSRSHSV